jgi:transposase
MAAHRGEKHHRARCSDVDVRRAVNLVRILGTSRREVANSFGVSERTIYRWLAGVRRARRV